MPCFSCAHPSFNALPGKIIMNNYMGWLNNWFISRCRIIWDSDQLGTKNLLIPQFPFQTNYLHLKSKRGVGTISLHQMGSLKILKAQKPPSSFSPVLCDNIWENPNGSSPCPELWIEPSPSSCVSGIFHGIFLLCVSVLPKEIPRGVAVADVNAFSPGISHLPTFPKKEFGPPCLSVKPGGNCHARFIEQDAGRFKYILLLRKIFFQGGKSSICLDPLHLRVWNVQAERLFGGNIT